MATQVSYFALAQGLPVCFSLVTLTVLMHAAPLLRTRCFEGSIPRGKTALDNPRRSLYYYNRAEVAELVDALRSGRSERTLIGVRVPASAPNQLKSSRASAS